MKLAFALLLSLSFAAAAQPSEIVAEYRLSNSGVTIGSVKESFVRKGDTYAIQSVTRSEGALKAFIDDEFTVESRGRVGAEGLRPLAYGERRLKDPKRDLTSTFDWDKGVMHTLLRGENSEAALPAATQDRISVMYQFANVQSLGDTLVVSMADRRRVELYTYRLVGEERLATPAGEFDTRHYQRVVATAKDTRADVWLAKDRFNFPVRVVFDNPKGFRLEQTVVSLAAR
jgi:hypothetical protein